MQKKKFWVALTAGVLGVAVLAVSIICGLYIKRILDNQYTLQVVLSGNSEISLEYRTPYEETGAVAEFFGTHLHTEKTSVPVCVTGEVDSNTVGSYLLKYTASYDDFTGTAYRVVHVVDTNAPEITLVADPEKFTFPNETYIEEGFTATDDYDGDLTANVKRTETREKVTYTVADSSGNTTTVERVIVYDDPIPPELKIKGGQKISLYVGQAYKEPGYTATDNCDGDLTDSVKVDGSVNSDKTGNYTLVYTVTDSYNNTVSVSRTVTVKNKVTSFEQQLNTVTPNGKVIYLTFDDGPSSHTPRLLDVLKKHNVKATFFVVNNRYTSTIKRIAQEGHSVGIHTSTHNFKQIYSSEKAYFADLETMQNVIVNQTGSSTNLLRFPGGSSNTVSKFNSGIMTALTQRVKKHGFRYFDWNVDSRDAGGARTATQVFRNVTNGASRRQISIVLQHDTKGFSVDAVEKIIIWGLENGYQFLPLNTSSPVCEHTVRN